MASPVVRSTSSGKGNTSTTASTSQNNLTYPTGIAAGDLLILTLGIGSNATVSSGLPGGWTQLASDLNGTTNRVVSYYLVAAGTESGAFPTLTLSGATYMVWSMMRIDGYAGTPQVGTAATGTSVNANPPSKTASWSASDDGLAIAYYSQDDSRSTPTSVPSGYTSVVHLQHGPSTAGATGVLAGTAYKSLTATNTEDPGTYTSGRSDTWVANTILVDASGGTQAITVAAIGPTATVASPDVASASVPQVREFVTGLPFPLGISVGQTLSVAEITSTAAVPTPALGTLVALTVAPISSGTSFGTVTLAVAGINVPPIGPTSTVPTPGLSAVAALDVAAIAAGTAVPDPAISMVTHLVVAEITGTTVGTPDLEATVALIVASISSTTVLTPGLTSVLRQIVQQTYEETLSIYLPTSRYGIDVAKTIILKDGVITVKDYPMQTELSSADAYYLGGHQYALTQAEYDALIAAGGSSYVEIV